MPTHKPVLLVRAEEVVVRWFDAFILFMNGVSGGSVSLTELTLPVQSNWDQLLSDDDFRIYSSAYGVTAKTFPVAGVTIALPELARIYDIVAFTEADAAGCEHISGLIRSVLRNSSIGSVDLPVYGISATDTLASVGHLIKYTGASVVVDHDYLVIGHLLRRYRDISCYLLASPWNRYHGLQQPVKRLAWPDITNELLDVSRPSVQAS